MTLNKGPFTGIDGKAEDKAEAIKRLFPDAETERNQLTMMTRTPPHMVMALVHFRMVEEALAFLQKQEAKAYVARQAALSGDTNLQERMIAEQGLLSADDEDFDEEKLQAEIQAFLSGEREELNLLKIFREEYDLRMISRNGEGRSELIEIFSNLAKGSKEDKEPSRDLVFD